MKKLALTLALSAAPLTNLYASAAPAADKERNEIVVYHESDSSFAAKVGAVTGVGSAVYVSAPHVRKGFDRVAEAARNHWNSRTEEQKQVLVAAAGATAAVVVYAAYEPAYGVACVATEVTKREVKKAWRRTRQVAAGVYDTVEETFADDKKFDNRVFKPAVVGVVGGFVALVARAFVKNNNK